MFCFYNCSVSGIIYDGIYGVVYPQQMSLSASFPLICFPSVYLSLVPKKIVSEVAVIFFILKVDDGGDEEETNMRNGGDRGNVLHSSTVTLMWNVTQK